MLYYPHITASQREAKRLHDSFRRPGRHDPGIVLHRAHGWRPSRTLCSPEPQRLPEPPPEPPPQPMPIRVKPQVRFLFGQPCMEDIRALVAWFYKKDPEDLISERQTWDVTRPRQVAMYLCRRLTRHSMARIGKLFGGRDHTTINSGFHRVRWLIGDREKPLPSYINVRANSPIDEDLKDGVEALLRLIASAKDEQQETRPG